MRILPLLLLLLLCPSVFAQSDDCSNATLISGDGSWAFDTTNVTTSQFNGGGCQHSDAHIDNDVFFVWRSTIEGSVNFDTFGSAFDTRLRVHRGRDCAASCLGHNDDSGNLQSSLRIGDVQLGEAFLIQVGGFAGALGTGVLNIHAAGCAAGLGDQFEDNDTAATAAQFPPSFRKDLTINASDPDFYLLPVPAGYRARVSLSLWSYSPWTELLDGAGQIVAPRSASGREILWKFSNTTGALVDYQLGIGSTSSHCGPYGIEFSVEIDDCGLLADDALEDNDTCASPTTLTPGVYKGLLGFFGDPDVYEVVVPPGVILTVFGDMPGLAGSITNYFGPGFLACSSPLIEARFQYGYLNYVNATNTPQSVLFVVQPPGHLGPECYGYDLSVHLDANSCLGVIPDYFDQSGQVWIEDGAYADLSVSSADPDVYELCVPPLGNVLIDALFISDEARLSMNLESRDGSVGVGGVGSARGNSSIAWTNPSATEAQMRLTVRRGVTRPQGCSTYDLIVQGTCGCHPFGGELLCIQSPNFGSAIGAQLSTGLGCGVGGTELDLQVEYGPPGQMGFILMSSVPSASYNPVGNGDLCLSGAVTRFNQGASTNSVGVFDGFGRFQSLLGNGDVNGYGFRVPVGIPYSGTLISAGDTWHFQLWFREPNGSSNFSTGLSVTF